MPQRRSIRSSPLLYTDGITDLRAGLRDRLGLRRLQELLAEPSPSASELIGRLERTITQYEPGELTDDAAAMAWRRN
jgi:serine phosphatase RsbU (regulator of sigma subunit)